ncbi:RidA family protein [Dankookia sp. P2]|uniref:RidA family protein n=1 Tax=Dankookia sp. P2 TaxID=3423955 RepID=UPI003D67CCAE
MALQHIKAGPPKTADAPFSWAVVAGGRTLHSVHIPVRADGSIETGDAEAQAEAALSDLGATLRAAGAAPADVAAAQVFLTSLEHRPAVDRAWRRFFAEPWPVRACVAVAALPTPGTVIEIVVQTALPG